jgi:hypothetical protein
MIMDKSPERAADPSPLSLIPFRACPKPSLHHTIIISYALTQSIQEPPSLAERLMGSELKTADPYILKNLQETVPEDDLSRELSQIRIESRQNQNEGINQHYSLYRERLFRLEAYVEQLYVEVKVLEAELQNLIGR